MTDDAETRRNRVKSTARRAAEIPERRATRSEMQEDEMNLLQNIAYLSRGKIEGILKSQNKSNQQGQWIHEEQHFDSVYTKTNTFEKQHSFIQLKRTIQTNLSMEMWALKRLEMRKRASWNVLH